MPMKKNKIINIIIYIIIFSIGCCCGKLIDWGYFVLNKEISIIDAISLFLTIGCAIYISKVLEKEVQDVRIEKEMFISLLVKTSILKQPCRYVHSYSCIYALFAFRSVDTYLPSQSSLRQKSCQFDG